MKWVDWFTGPVLVLVSVVAAGQVDKIVIPAGTPEDQALQAISNEQDGQKKLAMYEDFLQKFSSNPAAVAYGNWQISQYYQGAGDMVKALSYGRGPGGRSGPARSPRAQSSRRGESHRRGRGGGAGGLAA